MENKLSNHKFLVKLSQLHESKTKPNENFLPWFVDINQYRRIKNPFNYYFMKISTVILLILFFYGIYQVNTIIIEATRCSPAPSEIEWYLNNCEEKTGMSWEEYVWPNRY